MSLIQYYICLDCEHKLSGDPKKINGRKCPECGGHIAPINVMHEDEICKVFGIQDDIICSNEYEQAYHSFLEINKLVE